MLYTPSPRNLARLFVIGALLLCAAGPVPAGNALAESEPSGKAYPKLRLLTDAGAIEIELFPDAAPAATARLLTLADGRAEIVLQEAWPHSRVVSATIPELEDPPLPIEIDAVHLGLDRDRIPDPGAAMDVLQDEILPVHSKNKTSPPTEAFGRWIETWRAEREPGFLVGLDRKRLFEGFGFVYREGLASRPVEQGTVLLRPATPSEADPRLVFSLADRPLKTGRWMVIGRVVQGLDLLRDLSLAPLANPVAKSGPLARPAIARVTTPQTTGSTTDNAPTTQAP